jgi:pimeloyl-ACP methyl ester carboxylesterase
VDRTVVIVHGYSDAKVGGIAWAPLFHSLGYHILAIDLRAHGESGGTYSTAGYWERHDLNQVIDRIKNDKPRETRTLVLFGVSLGAACVAAAVQTRDDIAAVIFEGPYTNYPDAVRAHGELLGAPGGWLHRATIRVAEWMSRANFDEVKPVDLIPTIPCPVMIIHALDDFSMAHETPGELRTALDRHGDPRDVLHTMDGAGHVLCLSCDPEQYQARVEAFLTSVMAREREVQCEVGR